MTALLLINKEAFLFLLLFTTLGFFRTINKSNVEEQSQLRKVIIQNRAKRKIQKSQIKAWKVRFKNYKARQHLTNTRAVNQRGQSTEKVEVHRSELATKNVYIVAMKNIKNKSDLFWSKLLGSISGSLGHIYDSLKLFEVSSNLLSGNYVSLAKNIAGVLLWPKKIFEIFNIKKTSEPDGEISYIRNVKIAEYVMITIDMILGLLVTLLQGIGNKIFNFIIGDPIQNIEHKMQEKITVNRVTIDWTLDPTIPRLFSSIGLIIKHYFVSFINKSEKRIKIFNFFKILYKVLTDRWSSFIEFLMLMHWKIFNLESIEDFLSP